ncbi:MAG: O-antigen ligase family protein [Acidobacteria bacterium]|nr:O-antigen ligase family protein [Acidobacteriota bacterium]
MSAQSRNAIGQGWERVGFNLVWMLVFTIPWGDMVLLPMEIQASRALTILTFGAWLLSLWRGQRMRPLTAPHLWMLLFVVWVAFNTLWTPEAEKSFRRTLSFFQLFLDAWLVHQCCWSADRRQRLMLAYVLGGYIGFAGLMYNFFRDVHQGDGRYTAPGFDPNDLAVTLALGIPIAWRLGFGARQAVWLSRVYIPCAILGCVLSASRSGLVTLAVCLLFPLLAFPARSARAIVGAMVLSGLCLAVVTSFWSEVSTRRLSTITHELTAGDLNGRVDIWQHGIEAFFEHPFTGVGAGGFAGAVGARRSGELAAHNTFLGVLVEHGLVGLTIFLGVLAALFWRARKAPSPESSLWTVLLLGWSVAASALSWENRELTWLLWGLCAAQPCLGPRQARLSSHRAVLWRGQAYA